MLRKKKITEPQNTKFECLWVCVCVDIPANKVGGRTCTINLPPPYILYNVRIQLGLRKVCSQGILLGLGKVAGLNLCNIPKSFSRLVLSGRWRKHNKHHLYEFQSESNSKKDELHARQHHLFSIDKRRGFSWKIAIFQKKKIKKKIAQLKIFLIVFWKIAFLKGHVVGKCTPSKLQVS